MINVITPVHAAGSKYMPAAYASLLSQTSRNWQWTIVVNNGGVAPAECLGDPRVSIVDVGGESRIGRLKLTACRHGGVGKALELDCDDELHPRAIELVSAALDRADFVYSDFADWRDGGPGSYEASWYHEGGGGYPYGAAYGWERYPVEHRGRQLIAMRAPPVTPQNVRLVDWSPNHVRAWRMDAYNRVGGHNPELAVADDHDLIVRMFLSGASFEHIPECLYFYRVHAANTVSNRNAEIRGGTWGVYNRNIFALAEKFARDNGLGLVDLCGALGCPPGYVSIDRSPGAAIRCDLDRDWKLADGSVGVLRAYDALEHLRDPVHTMNEAYRVLAPGGFMMVSVPSTNGLGAFCDPTHVSFWNRLSFRYYCDPQYMRYVSSFRGQFQLAKLIEWYPTEWHKQENVPYVEAHLIHLGNGYTPMGALF